MKGTVKRIMHDKGFGFIKGEDNNEYFFHKSEVKNAKFEEVTPDTPVTFEDGDGPKGPRAEDVYVE